MRIFGILSACYWLCYGPCDGHEASTRRSSVAEESKMRVEVPNFRESNMLCEAEGTLVHGSPSGRAE